MSRAHLLAAAGLLGSAAVIGVGCTDYVAEWYTPLTDPSLADGGTDGPPPGCIPSTSSTPVADTCGVFVSPEGDDTNGKGTQAAPYKTITVALTKGSTIYACAGTTAYSEAVVVDKAVTLFGALDCATWAYDAAKRTPLTAPADAVPLTLSSSASGSTVDDFAITAADAMTAGGSSIAVLVNGGKLDITNGTLTAGAAQDGGKGANGVAMNLDGSPGAAGADACSIGTHSPGPMGSTNTCVTGGSSTAGNGGDGGQVVSNMLQPAVTGTDGSASPIATPVGADDGKGGAGEGQSGAPLCVRGDDGTPGGAGNAGEGAGAPGAIGASGYQGLDGKSGTSGSPGQGGGGGGGAKGGLSVLCGATTTSVPGASGGAGGTGGCGGAFGAGGTAGGSSIALLVLDAQVTLATVTLTAGKGGNGGSGGSGQSGGAGGGGGTNGAGGPVNDACPGGKGAKGGSGGSGGGGQGGHSLGIAFQGTKAPTGGNFIVDMTKNGTGGPGGSGNATTNMGAGANGVAENCWDFGKNAPCGM